MVTRWIKIGIMSTVGLLLIGGVLFGRDLASYLRTSAHSVQSAVKDAVPIEFELQRARDMVEEIIPEMHANIRLIAQEEVEIAAIKSDIQKSRQLQTEEKKRIQKLAELVASHQPTYNLGGYEYSPQQLKDDLARRFETYKESVVVLQGKQRLLETREKSLQAAMQVLAKTKSQKSQIEDQIEILQGKYQTLKATAVGSGMQLDSSKLAQTEKLIGDIKKRLDVAERVLSHEAKFAQPIALDVVDEKDLLSQVKDYFAAPSTQPTTPPAESFQ